MVIKTILGLTNILLLLVSLVLLTLCTFKDNEYAKYKISIIRIIIAAIVAISAMTMIAIRIVNEDNGWIFEFILIVVQPLSVVSDIKSVLWYNFESRKNQIKEQIYENKNHDNSHDYPLKEQSEDEIRINVN